MCWRACRRACARASSLAPCCGVQRAYASMSSPSERCFAAIAIAMGSLHCGICAVGKGGRRRAGGQVGRGMGEGSVC